MRVACLEGVMAVGYRHLTLPTISAGYNVAPGSPMHLYYWHNIATRLESAIYRVLSPVGGEA